MESDFGLNISLSSPSDASTSSCSRPKQLIFDRRYGWVFEEWVEPSEHANVGGRGLFSVVPLTAATINLTYRAANATADLVVQSIENRSEIAADIRNRWTSARLLACQELKKHVNNVPFLRTRSFSAFPGVVGVGAKAVEVQRHRILQSGSRFSRDLTDRGRAIGATVSNQVNDGMHILQQAFHEGRVRANERLHRLLPDVDRKQEASAYVQIQEVFPFPPELMDRLRRVLAKAGEHLQQILLARDGDRVAAQAGQRIGPAIGASGVACSNPAVGEVGLGPHIFSEVLSRGRAVGHEVSRQAKECFKLGHVLVHGTQQTGTNLSHIFMDDKVNDDRLKVYRSKSQEGPASSQGAEIEDPGYDDEVLSRSPLLTMVAAADDEDDQRVQAPVSSQSTARVFIKSTTSTGKRNRKRLRKGGV